MESYGVCLQVTKPVNMLVPPLLPQEAIIKQSKPSAVDLWLCVCDLSRRLLWDVCFYCFLPTVSESHSGQCGTPGGALSGPPKTT